MKNNKSKSNRKKQSNGKTENVLKIIMIVIVALLLTFTAAEAFGNVTVSSMSDSVKIFFSQLKPGNGYPYEVDTSKIKDIEADGSKILVLKNNSTLLISSSAKEISACEFSYDQPVMKKRGSKVLVYDRNSTSYRVQTSTSVTFEDKEDGNIQTGAIGKKGNFALGIYGDNVMSVLNVYDKNRQKIFQWDFSTERISAIALSDNGKYAAVATFSSKDAQAVSKVYVFKFDSEKYVSCTEYQASTIVELDYDDDLNITVIGDNIHSVIAANKTKTGNVDFGSDTLHRFSSTQKGTNAVLLAKYGNDLTSSLTVYSGSVKLYSKEFDKQAKSVYCTDKYTAVLCGNTIFVYNKTGTQVSKISIKSSAQRVIICGNKVYSVANAKIECYNIK